jgi:hypothetical protein
MATVATFFELFMATVATFPKNTWQPLPPFLSFLWQPLPRKASYTFIQLRHCSDKTVIIMFPLLAGAERAEGGFLKWQVLTWEAS